MLCVVIAHQDKWTTVLQGKVIGASKHIDYSLFHHKAKDVAALKAPITKFIWVGADDQVTEVIQAEQLKERGCNYKTAKRDEAELLEAETWEVSCAITLARGAEVAEPVKPTEEHKPAEDSPKVMLSAEGAANGLGDILGQADEPAQPEAEPEAQPEAEPDPLTVKPSRSHKKHRR